MYYAEKEIFSQFESIKKTTDHIKNHKDDIKSLFDGAKKVVFVGSGSSFSIAKSAATITSLRSDISSIAVAAGDILVNFDRYAKILDNSVIVSISRSGSTSELVYAVKMAKQKLNCKSISLCARENVEIEKWSDYSIEIPWAFDESVCQTRTVSNLYAGCVLIIAISIEDNLLRDEMLKLTEYSNEFQSKYNELLDTIGKVDFSHGIVLGECEIAGLAEEGALAFKEICQLNSNHYPVLDVRHGPMVMIDDKSLVILAMRDMDDHITNLVKDIKSKGAFCLTMGVFSEEIGGDWHIQLPNFENMAVAAIYMIFCIQVITFSRALALGVNPDEPDGLDPWINLHN